MILRRPRKIIEQEHALTAELKQELPNVLSKFYRYLGREISVHQLHATIGGKNNTYTDCVRMQFQDPDEFAAKWLDGLLRQYALEIEEAQLGRRTYTETGSKQLVHLLRDDVVRNYVLKFLRRNFFRQFIPRTRYKPPEHLWSIWFGSGQMTYGLLTSPAYRRETWRNDVSEIRRAPYVYWTVGHVLHAGLVAPEEDNQLQFRGLRELVNFYRFVLKKLSRSSYEKNVAELYLGYLEASADPLNEPFLIPEFRYRGLETNHEYRLDFTVFNAHVLRFTGFELSPHSSHVAVRGLKSNDPLPKFVPTSIRGSSGHGSGKPDWRA